MITKFHVSITCSSSFFFIFFNFTSLSNSLYSFGFNYISLPVRCASIKLIPLVDAKLSFTCCNRQSVFFHLVNWANLSSICWQIGFNQSFSSQFFLALSPNTCNHRIIKNNRSLCDCIIHFPVRFFASSFIWCTFRELSNTTTRSAAMSIVHICNKKTFVKFC